MSRLGMLLAAEVGEQMALLPLATLLLLRWRGQRREAAWWWLAGAFLVSWLADEAARWTLPAFVSIVYPLAQAGIVLAVLQPRPVALVSVVALTVLGALAILWEAGRFPDLLLRAGCWGAIVASVGLHRPVSLLRGSLLVYFGLGLLAWAGYVALPGWTSWGAYQLVRFAGLALFSLAVWRAPRLKVAA